MSMTNPSTKAAQTRRTGITEGRPAYIRPKTKANTPEPPARQLGETINSLTDNATHCNRETLQEHVGHIASDYIVMRDAFDALLYACRLAIPHVETAIIVTKGLNYPANNTQYALDQIRAAIARAEGGAS